MVGWIEAHLFYFFLQLVSGFCLPCRAQAFDGRLKHLDFCLLHHGELRRHRVQLMKLCLLSDVFGLFACRRTICADTRSCDTDPSNGF